MLAFDLHVDGGEARRVMVSESALVTGAGKFLSYSLLYRTRFAIALTNTIRSGGARLFG